MILVLLTRPILGVLSILLIGIACTVLVHVLVFHLTSQADCEWKPWSEWESCSQKCGNGTQNRNRSILIEHSGSKCNESEIEQRRCNFKPCPGIFVALSGVGGV